MEDTLIVSDPAVMARITVEHVLREIANGLTIDQILIEYPHLTREGVVAALHFAAESMRTETVYPFDQEPLL